MGCGICGKSGHNKRTCPNDINRPPTAGVSIKSDSNPLKNTRSNNKLASINAVGTNSRAYSTEASFSKSNSENEFGYDEQHDLSEIIKISREINKSISDSRLSLKKDAVQGERKVKTSKNENVVPKKDNSPSVLVEFSTKDPKPKQTKSTAALVSHWLNQEALERLNKGPTTTDGPGYIYIYRDFSVETDHDTSAVYKIGCTKNLPEKRVKQQEYGNKTKYTIIKTFETPYKFVTDTVIKRQLKAYNTPKKDGDGKTEWYTGSESYFEDTIRGVIKEVNAKTLKFMNFKVTA